MSAQPTLHSTSVARQTNLLPHFVIPPPPWRTTRLAAVQAGRGTQKMSRRPNLRRACTTGWWLGVGRNERRRVELKVDVVWTSEDQMVKTNPGRIHLTE